MRRNCRPAMVLIDATGRSFPLRGETVVGKGPDVDLLVHGNLAPRHARIRPVDGGWEVEAEGGTVYRNGAAVRRVPLHSGDRLVLGDVAIDVARAEEGIRRRGWIAAGVIFAVSMVALGLLVLLGGDGTAAGEVSTRLVLRAGESIRIEGGAGQAEILLPLADPASSLVELSLSAEGATRRLSLAVNGAPSLPIRVASERTVSLREGLVAGANRIVLAAEEEGGLPDLDLFLRVAPLPLCSPGACAAEARQELRRAERLLRERQVAPGNLFSAWQALRRARGLAIRAEEERLLAQVEARFAEAEEQLGERCGQLRLAAARHLAAEETAAALETAQRILAAFPTGDHACHASGLRLFELLGEGGGV